MSIFAPFSFLQQTAVTAPLPPSGIVLNKLFSWLDQGDTGSYTSGSVEWLDLSGNNVSASLFTANNVTGALNFSNTGTSSYFTYDGTNDYAKWPEGIYRNNTSTGDNLSASISLWFRTTGSGPLFVQAGNSDDVPTSGGGWIPWLYIDVSGSIRYSIGWTVNFNAGTSGVSSGSYNDGNWHNATVVYNGVYSTGTQFLYVDGVLESSGSCSGAANFDTIYNFFIGAGLTLFWPNNPYPTTTFPGDIGPFLFYTGSLTATEVQQNYDAVASRYP